MTVWLEEAIREVEQRAGEILPVQVVEAWVEAGVTGEAVVNSSGVRAGRSCTRIWAGMQVRWEAGGSFHESFRLMVPREGERFPRVDSVLERLESASSADRVLGLRPGSILVLLPEAAAVLVQAVAAVVHGASATVGGPVGEAWNLADDPLLSGMLFGGDLDGVGSPTGALVLAGEGRIRARLAGRGHAWRRSYKDPPLKGFSNLVVACPVGARPDGIVVTSLTIHRLAPNRYIATGEAVGGRICFPFNPNRIPVLLRGASGLPRLTASGILTPELVLSI
jgi:predicted Zn-dependent protease